MENAELLLILFLMLEWGLSPLFWSLVSYVRDPWTRGDRWWAIPLLIVVALLVLASASAAIWISFEI